MQELHVACELFCCHPWIILLLCSLITGFLLPGISPLEPMVKPTTQASSLRLYSTFVLMCDVPSMAFFL
jgi:hypothetical protein